MNASIENRFYDLLSRKLSGECLSSELKELEVILQNNPELYFFYSQVLKPSPQGPVDIDAAYLPHYVKRMYSGSTPNIHDQASVKMQPQSSSKQILIKTLVAASICLFVVLVWQLFVKTKNAVANKQPITIAGTHRESRSAITLIDGTIVRLNRGSKVSYAEGFGKKMREVYLEGEAYFEVAHNKHVPFIVHTNDADIKVLGTKFNVRSYSNESAMEASLISGSIELTVHNDAKQKILLNPSDKIIVRRKPESIKDTHEELVKQIELTKISIHNNVVAETCWVNDKVAFLDKAFSEIALDLEQKFDVTIEFKNKAIAQYKYTGVYDDDSAEDILKILQLIKPFEYTVNGKEIIIY